MASLPPRLRVITGLGAMEEEEEEGEEEEEEEEEGEGWVVMV